MVKRTKKSPNDPTRTVPHSIRLQVRIWVLGIEKATRLGMKMPAYISQLIVKDCEGG